jgi:superfamily I DNA and/or RNA helicase
MKSTSITAGKTVVLSGDPGQLPPTATFRIKKKIQVNVPKKRNDGNESHNKRMN